MNDWIFSLIAILGVLALSGWDAVIALFVLGACAWVIHQFVTFHRKEETGR